MNEIYMVQRTDTVHQSADKIFHKYDVGMSAVIVGFVEMPDETMEAKGKVVLDEIARLDRVENFSSNGVGRGNGLRRRRNKPENTVGDYLRNKTFRWEKRIVDNQVRYTIWRIQ